MGQTWGPSGTDRTQVGPMLAPWTLLSGDSWIRHCICISCYQWLNFWRRRCTCNQIISPFSQIKFYANLSVSRIISTMYAKSQCYFLSYAVLLDNYILGSLILVFFLWFGNSLISLSHYNNVIMSAMESQITGVSIVYSTVCSGAAQRKHQRSASFAFMGGIHRWPVNSPHKGPRTGKMFSCDEGITHDSLALWCLKLPAPPRMFLQLFVQSFQKI